MKKIITSVLFFGSCGVAFAQIGAGGLPPYSAGIDPLMQRYMRPQQMCKRTVNRKMTMCKLAPELSIRREKNKNCYFANSNESHCSAANTGKKGACAKVNEEKGLICMGTSFNSLNKCRAVCEVSTPLSKPACGQPSDCTGKTKKWYCVEESINIPETVWGGCPKPAEEDECIAVAPGTQGCSISAQDCPISSDSVCQYWGCAMPPPGNDHGQCIKKSFNPYKCDLPS